MRNGTRFTGLEPVGLKIGIGYLFLSGFGLLWILNGHWFSSTWII